MNYKNYFNLPTLARNMFKGRKTLSITLKMPEIDPSILQASRAAQIQSNLMRTSSVNSKRRPSVPRKRPELHTLRQTTIKLPVNNHPDSTPYCFSPIKTKYTPMPQKAAKIRSKRINIPEMIVKAETKENKEQSVDKNLHFYLVTFFEKVKEKYCEVYSQIDRGQKGYFDLDDVIDYGIMQQMGKADKEYEEIRVCAKELISVLQFIAGSKKVRLRHFLAFCSVFEHNKGEIFNLTDSSFIQRMKEQLTDLKDLFDCFTTKSVIDLKNVLSEISLKEKITRCRVFVENETVDFSRFLRCLPFFVWVYHIVNNIT
jgi:hypothetical protein